jgi:hypothetical protein
VLGIFSTDLAETRNTTDVDPSIMACLCAYEARACGAGEY